MYLLKPLPVGLIDWEQRLDSKDEHTAVFRVSDFKFRFQSLLSVKGLEFRVLGLPSRRYGPLVVVDHVGASSYPYLV